MSSIEKVSESLRDETVVNVEPTLLLVDVDPVNDDAINAEKSENEQTSEKAGWEYDALVKAYKHHPDNRVNARYARDFEGFTKPQVKPLNVALATDPDDEAAFFKAQMERFPLLDGRQHEKVLKEKLDLGKDAFWTLVTEEMTEEDARALEQLAIEGAGAYMTMFECNMRYVLWCTNRWAKLMNHNYSIGDALECGSMGIRRAIQKLEPKKGFKLSTYADWWIMQELQRGPVPLVYDVAYPVNGIDRVRDTRTILKLAMLEEVVLDEAKCEELGINPKDVYAANYLLTKDRFSLDQPLSDDSQATYGDQLAAVDSDFQTTFGDEEFNSSIIQSLLESGGMTDPMLLTVMSLLDGIYLPGVDYDRKIQIKGYSEATIGQYVDQVRLGNIQISRGELVRVLGINIETIREMYDTTRAHMLNVVSLNKIKKELCLSDERYEELQSYFQLNNFVKDDDAPVIRFPSKQDRARLVISELRQYDADFDDVLERTMEIIDATIKLKENNRASMKKWLEHRFGIVQIGDLPIRRTDAKTRYSFSRSHAVVGESIFLAVLSDSWGKIPKVF